MSSITIPTRLPSPIVFTLFCVGWGLTLMATMIGFSSPRPETGLPWLFVGQLPLFVLAGLIALLFFRKQSRLSAAVFIGSALVGNGLSLLITFVSNQSPERSIRMTLVLLAFAPLLYSGWAMLILFYRMWAAIQDGEARTTPGKAIGYLFIPFFNIYWAFQIIWGYAKDANRYIERHSIYTTRLPEGLFLAYVILSFSGWIPLLGPILVAINFIVATIMMARICTATNDIVATVTARPQSSPVTIPNIATSKTPARLRLGINLIAFGLVGAVALTGAALVGAQLRTTKQILAVDAPLWPAELRTFNHNGEEYDIYRVPTEQGTLELALLEKGRRESQFINPAEPNGAPLTWQGSWRDLERVWAPRWDAFGICLVVFSGLLIGGLILILIGNWLVRPRARSV